MLSEAMKSTPEMEKASRAFIELWGDMATHWGISRSMAQVYALLYAHDEPFDTDAIMEQLNISRGNANINIRKLLEWGLIQKLDRPDSRRDLYTAEKDVWQLTIRIIEERRKRELTPVSEQLKQIASDLSLVSDDEEQENTEEMKAFQERLLQMAEFTALFNELTKLLLPLLQSRQQIPLLMELVKRFSQSS